MNTHEQKVKKNQKESKRKEAQKKHNETKGSKTTREKDINDTQGNMTDKKYIESRIMFLRDGHSPLPNTQISYIQHFLLFQQLRSQFALETSAYHR